MKGEGNGKDVATNEDIMKYLKQMNETLTGINTKLEVLEGKHDKLEERVTARDAKLDSLQEKYNYLIALEQQRIRDVEKMKIQAVYNEMHNKRANIVV